jgi:hypothetical protein
MMFDTCVTGSHVLSLARHTIGACVLTMAQHLNAARSRGEDVMHSETVQVLGSMREGIITHHERRTLT